MASEVISPSEEGTGASEVDTAGSWESTSLLQDTVDQYEKVINMERTVLSKGMSKHKRELEEVCTELGMKEEELAVWEQRLQQIKEDNEIKLALAKGRFDKEKFGGRGKGRGAPSGVSGGAMLGLITEDDEAEGIAEGDEEDEDDDEDVHIVREASKDSQVQPESERTTSAQSGSGEGPAGRPSHPAAEAVNTLAYFLANELTALNIRWQDLSAGAAALETQTARSPQLTAAPQPVTTAVATLADTADGQAASTYVGIGERGRMTVEQRIDRLQRDIRIETDRILQERGTPGVTIRIPRGSGASLSVATTSAGVGGGISGGSTPVSSYAGFPGQGQPLYHGSGLNTPVQSTSSYASTISAPSKAGDNPANRGKGGGVMQMTRPGEMQDVVFATASQSAPTAAASSGMPASKAAPFHPVGSVVRCVSPSGAAQVARSRLQPAPGRTLAALSNTFVRADNLQSSIGSSGGPPRLAGYGPQATSAYVGQSARHSSKAAPPHHMHR